MNNFGALKQYWQGKRAAGVRLIVTSRVWYILLEMAIDGSVETGRSFWVKAQSSHQMSAMRPILLSAYI